MARAMVAVVVFVGILCVNSSKRLERKAGKIEHVSYYRVQGGPCGHALPFVDIKLKVVGHDIYYGQFTSSGKQKLEEDRAHLPVRGWQSS